MANIILYKLSVINYYSNIMLALYIAVTQQEYQGWTLRIVRLPWTTESTSRTTEISTPLVLQDK